MKMIAAVNTVGQMMVRRSSLAEALIIHKDIRIYAVLSNGDHPVRKKAVPINSLRPLGAFSLWIFNKIITSLPANPRLIGGAANAVGMVKTSPNQTQTRWEKTSGFYPKTAF